MQQKFTEMKTGGIQQLQELAKVKQLTHAKMMNS